MLTSAERFSAEVNSRLGWSALSPFELNEIRPNDKAIFERRPLAAAEASFLDIDQAGIAVVTWKLAEDGKGTILRLLETAGRRSTATIHVPIMEVTAAWRCNAVEDNQQRLEYTAHDVRVSVEPFQIVTVRLESTR